jgi:hypothetical protein
VPSVVSCYYFGPWSRKYLVRTRERVEKLERVVRHKQTSVMGQSLRLDTPNLYMQLSKTVRNEQVQGFLRKSS